jgi:hypothetical protein
MADRDPAELSRENAYLKQRNAQLQLDITDLSAEVERLRRIQDRLHDRAAKQTPDAPAGGRPKASESHAPAAVVGVTPDEASPADYGITRESIDYFRVGGYRYTSVKEAIAEARRQGTVT